MLLVQNIVLDIIAVSVLVVSAIIGRRRGFIKAVSGLIALVLAVFVASFLAKAATPYVAEKFITPQITQAIEGKTQVDIESSPERLPEIFKEIGIPSTIVDKAISETSETVTNALKERVFELTTTIATKIAFGVLFIVFFIISFIILKLLMKVVNLTAKIPGIKFLNKSLGLILGLLYGYLIIVLVSFALTHMGIFLSSAMIAETTVLKFITSVSPLSLI